MEYDSWQKKVLSTKGNQAICAGRQVGKSTVISEDAGKYALENGDKVIMIIASVERQALLLFEKVLSYIYQNNKGMICKGKDRPTKHMLKLTNGAVIHCLPTGDSGYGIRGFTIDRLYADEAAFIKEEVWAAVTPMLATTGGDIILLSTPMGTENYFYRMCHNDGFTFTHVNAEDIAESRQEPQRGYMKEHHKNEKERMTKLQYKQEYLGEFVGGIKRMFSDELIKDRMIAKKDYKPKYAKFQGVDVGRTDDDTVLVSVDRVAKKQLKMFDLEILPPQKLTDTARIISHKDKSINHKKIYIDSTGIGWGVYDPLSEDPQTKRKIVSIQNAQKSIDKIPGKNTPRRKPLLKEDLYFNLLNLMETDNIELFDDPNLEQSLRSVQIEHNGGETKIFGNYTHIAEALIRAAWCIKDKTLNIYIY